MGAALTAIIGVFALIAIIGFIVVRVRQPAPPRHANEGDTDTAWDSDGALPKDAEGMPFAGPEGQQRPERP
jgi:hypothetical protein